MTREIRFYKKYFIDFYLEQELNVQEKIEYVFKVIQTVDRVPSKFLKHIEGTDGLYEIRVKYGNEIFRIFCCFDEGKIVILFNGFQKKSQRVPGNEIERALKLMKEYFDRKKRR